MAAPVGWGANSAPSGSFRPSPQHQQQLALQRLIPVYSVGLPQAGKAPELPRPGKGQKRPRESSESQPTSGVDVQEALAWCAAFRANDAGIDASEDRVDLRSALRLSRACFTLSQLEGLRRSAPASNLAVHPAFLGQSSAPPSWLAERFAQFPERTLAEIGMGLHLAALAVQAADDNAWAPRPPATPCGGQSLPAVGCTDDADAEELEPVIVGIVDPRFRQTLESVRSDLIGRYIGLSGTVVRTASVAPLLTELHFACSRCGAEVTHPAEEGRLEYPKECPRKCKFARFDVRKDRCKAIDWQRVRLQEDFAELAAVHGPRRMPLTLDCNLKHALVCTCVPGDAVSLYGIVRCTPTSGSIGKGGEGKNAPNRALYSLSLDVRAVVNSRRLQSKAGAAGGPELDAEDAEDFTPLQLEFIREIHSEAERFPLLVASFCPQIYGQRLVKAALLLALLGGLPVHAPGAERRLRRRGDIHVLLLGDPGLGKSELLRALAALSSRGVYVCGNSSSAAGLTASVVRDPSGEFALEAGALILADNGICCIDELDKMGTDQQALLEAMEQQTVSIAKAGIVCTLPARATVVTAANPHKGKFDMSLNITQNLKGVMSEALLSRFDVVFLMRDEASANEDAALSRHIVQTRVSGVAPRIDASTQEPADWAASAQAAAGPSLNERCKAAGAGANALPLELLSTYVRYAKRYAHPSMSKGARECIKEYYLKRRGADHRASGQLPVTPRQLEALVRLSEARARAELRRVVLRSDVLDVIEIVCHGTDGVLELLPEAPQRKGKSPLSAVVSRIREAVERRARAGQQTFRLQELRQFAGTTATEQLFDKALQRLNMEENVLIVASGGNYTYVGGC